MAQAQKTTRLPEICNGCVEGTDLPSQIEVVDGKPRMKHYFVCTFFTTCSVKSAPTVKSSKCMGKRLIPLSVSAEI